jgi:hypothetical protein
MDWHQMDAWTKWRRAEEQDGIDEADRAFAELARDWHGVQAPAALIRRVAALGRSVAEPPSRWASWWLRTPVAAAVVASGVVLGALPSGSVPVLLLASVQAVASGVGWVLGVGGAWLSAVLVVGESLVHVALVLGRATVEPLPLTLLVMNLLVASGGLFVLRRVMVVREV